MQKAINYRKTSKAITDAPNLRGDDQRNCWTCNHFKSLPRTTQSENLNDLSAEIHAPRDMIEMPSGRGVCSQFDFETDQEWVCDGWLEYQPQLATVKQADGKIRWIVFSSSSYEDNDGEIVSQKALEADTAQMDAAQAYGTLDWWHTPVIIGDCDFSAMHGRISIESGTFRDNAIGEAITRAAKELGASRTFYNPKTQPDATGVYHNIRTISRAILPADRASNLLTRVVVAKEKTMLEDKIRKLKEILGGNPEAEKKVDALLAAAEQTDNAAQVAGLTAKEIQPPDQVGAKDIPPTPLIPQKAWFVADMTPDEFDTRLQAAVEKFLTPAVKEIGSQIAVMNETQVKTAKERDDKIIGQIKTAQDLQTDLSARLAALEGLTPRAYRPTQDPSTETTKEIADAKTPKGSKQASESLAGWLGTA